MNVTRPSPLTPEQLAELVEGAPFGIYVYELEDPEDDRSLRLVYGNPASEQLTGVPVRDLVGRLIDECFPLLRAQGFPQRFARVIRTGEPERYESNYYSDERTLAAAYQGGVRPLGGRRVGTWFENVTQQRQAEQARVRELESEVSRRAEAVAELSAARADLEERLALIEAQRDLIERLSSPILRVWDEVIAVPLVGAVDADRAAVIMEQVLDEIAARDVRFALLDLTGVEAIDTTTADQLARIAGAVRLLGAEAIITGIRPAVASAMVTLGIDLQAMETRRSLREGLRDCLRAITRDRRAAEG